MQIHSKLNVNNCLFENNSYGALTEVNITLINTTFINNIKYYQWTSYNGDEGLCGGVIEIYSVVINCR